MNDNLSRIFRRVIVVRATRNKISSYFHYKIFQILLIKGNSDLKRRIRCHLQTSRAQVYFNLNPGFSHNFPTPVYSLFSLSRESSIAYLSLSGVWLRAFPTWSIGWRYQKHPFKGFCNFLRKFVNKSSINLKFIVNYGFGLIFAFFG